MIKKTLFVYNSLNLFDIINEIKENFYFELKYIDTKNHKKINFEQYENYLIISTNFYKNIKNCTTINNLPTKISKLIETINLNFLKKQFQNQSVHKIKSLSFSVKFKLLFSKDIFLEFKSKVYFVILYSD